MNMSLTLIQRWKHCYSGASIDIHDAVRYIWGRDEGVRSWSQLRNPHLWASWEWNYPDQGRTPSSGPIVPHCVVDVNSSPECQCHHRRVKANDIDMFRSKHFFLLDGFSESEPEIKPRTLIAHPLWLGTTCSRWTEECQNNYGLQFMFSF